MSIINMEAGIHNLSADMYHSDPCITPSLSSSIAKIILEQSPAHAWLAHPRLNPKFEREAESRADLGSAAHAMLLENDSSKIVVVDAPDWRTKDAKAARDAATAGGKFAVLSETYKKTKIMVNTAMDFMSDSEISSVFFDGISEQSVLWKEGDFWFRCRPDRMSADKRILVDYKTTSNSAPDAVAKQIARMQYDLQSEFYLRGINAVTGNTDSVFVFLFQEIEPPFACSLLSLSAAYKEVGRLKMNRAVSLWERSLQTNNWPGYDGRIRYLEPKPWTLAEAEALGDDV